MLIYVAEIFGCYFFIYLAFFCFNQGLELLGAISSCAGFLYIRLIMYFANRPHKDDNHFSDFASKRIMMLN